VSVADQSGAAMFLGDLTTDRGGSARPRLRRILRLTRPENCIVVVGLVVVAILTAHTKAHVSSGRVEAAVLAVAFTLAFGNVVNDVIDRPIDAVSKQWRPLPSGDVTTAQALVTASLCLLGAVVCSFALSIWQTVFVCGMCALAFWYSWKLKGRPLIGNLVVATQTALTIPFGAWVVGRATSATAYGALVVFCGVLVVEIGKTFEDAEADRRGKLRTIAHVIPSRFHHAAFGIMVATVGMIFLALGLAAPAVHVAPMYFLVFAPLAPLALCALSDCDESRSPTMIGYCLMFSKLFWPLCLLGLMSLH
jgi:geranylgeranylglycerol-phosphate geranylgeranyltransferase